MRCGYLWLLITLIIVCIPERTAYAACINPFHSAGTIEYFSADQIFKFCDGTSWVSFDGTETLSNCPVSGTLDYDSTLNAFKYCDGVNWKKVGCTASSCSTIGDICPDGSIYAGLSPDGSVPMFTTPADGGLMTWNNGNHNGWTNPVASCGTETSGSPGIEASCWTGKSNTEILITTDSDANTSGVQPHIAARYCADLIASGKNDWYLPAQDELNILHINRNQGALAGTFNLSNTEPDGFYWSSSTTSGVSGKYQRLGSGYQNIRPKQLALKVRCVRKDCCPALGTCATAGQIDYRSSNSVLAFCNGSHWFSMGPPTMSCP